MEAAQDCKDHTLQKDFADVLVIVTGGTICMVQSENGYVAAKGLGNRLKSLNVFYDKEFCEANKIDP